MNVHTQNIVRERKKRGETNELNRKIEKKKKENNKKKMNKKGREKREGGGYNRYLGEKTTAYS